MKVQMINRMVVTGIAFLAVVLGAGQVSASVVDLRNAAREESSLFHHYTLDATALDTDDMRFVDRAGSKDLSEVDRGSGHISNIVYETGFDVLSQAVTPEEIDDSNLAGLLTSGSDFPLSSNMTVECMVCPHDNDISLGLVLGSRPDSDSRGYYLMQNNSDLQTRVGTGSAQDIVTSFSTGHWYYVVSTYSVSGGNTLINSYYADLTAKGTLQHTVVDYSSAGTYGINGTKFGIGMLYNTGDYAYPAAAAIDEVALYDTVLSASTISSHLTALYQELPTVEYRELFPSDNTDTRFFPREGWQVNRGANAANDNNPVIYKGDTAFDESLLAVASDPSDTGITSGYLNNNTGASDTNYLYWTDEMVSNRLDVSWLEMVRFDAKFNRSSTVSIALRVDTNSTPADTSNDAWFSSNDFDNDSGISGINVSSSADWHRHELDLGGAEWTTLDFTPSSVLLLGNTEVQLPSGGMVTGFGVLEDEHVYGDNSRFDNFTIYAHRVYPPKGTLVFIQ